MRSLRRLQPKHDYSYGIYLYGFVVQQAVTALLPSLNNYLSVAIAMPIAIALAALSWHLVERPCLAMMRNKSRARFAASAAPMDVSV